MDNLRAVVWAVDQVEGIGTLVSVLAGMGGAFTGALGTYLARRYRIRSDNALTHQRQVFDQYHRLVEELRAQVGDLQGEVGKLQQHFMECRIENAALKSRIALLEMQIGSRPAQPGVQERQNDSM